MTTKIFMSVATIASVIVIEGYIYNQARANQLDSIGNIKNVDNSGPACWYWRVGKKGRNRTVLSTWAVAGGGAVMNLNGNDTKLKTVIPWKSYSLDNIKIQVKTKSHVSSDPESTDKGTIVITNAGRSQTIKVEGYCGV